MSVFVGALRRAYIAGTITVTKLDSLLATTKITQEEYDFIAS